MKLPTCAFGVSLVALLSSHALAEELLVPSGGTMAVEPGAKRLEKLAIGRDGTLTFSGSTTLYVSQLVTEPGATIRYDAVGTPADQILTLNALDASGLQELKVLASGRNGADAPSTAAAAGANGSNAGDCKLSDPDGSKASGGGRGKDGQAGDDAQHAADVTLMLPKVPPGARIAVSAVGGDGGRGQPGGVGGKGGNRSNCHDGRGGGDGGNGGKGGDAGDAGKIFVFVVVPDDIWADQAKRRAKLDTVQVTMNSSRGTPGAGGAGGNGGGTGKPATVGPGSRKAGDGGYPGQQGAAGDGPTANETNKQWASVDVMSQSAYSQFITQEMQKVFPGQP